MKKKLVKCKGVRAGEKVECYTKRSFVNAYLSSLPENIRDSKGSRNGSHCNWGALFGLEEAYGSSNGKISTMLTAFTCRSVESLLQKTGWEADEDVEIEETKVEGANDINLTHDFLEVMMKNVIRIEGNVGDVPVDLKMTMVPIGNGVEIVGNKEESCKGEVEVAD